MLQFRRGIDNETFRFQVPRMTKKSLPIPAGYEHATPYLVCKHAAQAIEFYKKAFGATELYRIPMPDGKVGHAEIKISGATIMLSDEFPEHGKSPATLGGSTVSLLVYVTDVDAFAERAVAAGAILAQPVKDQFYGDRSCRLHDPSGHNWSFATHIEDVSREEIKNRAQKLYGGG